MLRMSVIWIKKTGLCLQLNSGFVVHSTSDNQDTHEIGSIGFVIRNLAGGQPNRKFIAKKYYPGNSQSIFYNIPGIDSV